MGLSTKCRINWWIFKAVSTSWGAKWPSSRPHPVSRMCSYRDLRQRESLSPPFIPSCAIRAEQLRSCPPYPTGDYTSPSGSVVVGQGALSSPRGQESRWRPLRNGLLAQRRRVLARHHVNDARRVRRTHHETRSSASPWSKCMRLRYLSFSVCELGPRFAKSFIISMMQVGSIFLHAFHAFACARVTQVKIGLYCTFFVCFASFLAVYCGYA
jgi:hypothetical protein